MYWCTVKKLLIHTNGQTKIAGALQYSQTLTLTFAMIDFGYNGPWLLPADTQTNQPTHVKIWPF